MLSLHGGMACMCLERPVLILQPISEDVYFWVLARDSFEGEGYSLMCLFVTDVN